MERNQRKTSGIAQVIASAMSLLTTLPDTKPVRYTGPKTRSKFSSRRPRKSANRHAVPHMASYMPLIGRFPTVGARAKAKGLCK
jgi:hypothetical protein